MPNEFVKSGENVIGGCAIKRDKCIHCILSAWSTVELISNKSRSFLERRTAKKEVADFASNASTVSKIAEVISVQIH